MVRPCLKEKEKEKKKEEDERKERREDRKKREGRRETCQKHVRKTLKDVSVDRVWVSFFVCCCCFNMNSKAQATKSKINKQD